MKHIIIPVMLRASAVLVLFAPVVRAQSVDLAIGNISAGYDSWNASTGIIDNIYFDMLNNSNDAAGAFKVGLYFVNPNDYSESYLLNTFSRSGQGGNSVVTVTDYDVDVNQAEQMPPAGSWRLAVIIDKDEEVDDPDRSNNNLFLSTQGNNLTWNGPSSGADLNLAAAWQLRLWPNPTAGAARLSLNLPTPADARLTVLDALGRPVLEHMASLPAGPQHLELPLQGLPAGVYTCRVATAAGMAAVRVLLQP